MQITTGIDIVEVADFKTRISRSKSLKERLFTKLEIESCKSRGIEHLASRFAAKEAYAKASGAKLLKWHDVEIRNLQFGKPVISVKNIPVKIKSIDLSISQTRKITVAIVVILWK